MRGPDEVGGRHADPRVELLPTIYGWIGASSSLPIPIAERRARPAPHRLIPEAPSLPLRRPFASGHLPIPSPPITGPQPRKRRYAPDARSTWRNARPERIGFIPANPLEPRSPIRRIPWYERTRFDPSEDDGWPNLSTSNASWTPQRRSS